MVLRLALKSSSAFVSFAFLVFFVARNIRQEKGTRGKRERTRCVNDISFAGGSILSTLLWSESDGIEIEAIEIVHGLARFSRKTVMLGGNLSSVRCLICFETPYPDR
jgi:hypothetical protein